MWPALRSGDEAHCQRLARTPEVGEIVVARLGEAFVVHRVRQLTARGLVMRGDNCAASDPVVPLEEVVGVVTELRRKGRKVSAGQVGVGRFTMHRAMFWMRAKAIRVAGAMRRVQ
jgi:signal peptidase